MTPRAEPSRIEWRVRFEAFASRKTRDAAAATLPPYVTEIDRPPSDATVIDHPWTRRLFDGAFYVARPRSEQEPACSLVFVQSADGNTGAADPSTLGGGHTDKHLIYEGLSRVVADAVLAGAETVRGAEIVFSVWHPELAALRQSLGLPRHPVQIVATRRGLDLDDMLTFNVPEIPAILLIVEERAHAIRASLETRPWVKTVMLNNDRELARAFRELGSLGIRQISCVGGRHLARQLLDASLVDNLYLTTSPLRGGEPNTPIRERPIDAQLVVRKHGTGAESGVVFEQWRLAP